MASEIRLVSAADIALSVRCSGEPAPSDVPVVLTHGMGGDHTTWRPLARALRRSGRSVVSLDLRGHGRTGPASSYRLTDFRDDLAAVVDDLGVAQVDLVGHSLGAHAALRYAMTSPDRVRRMVLEEVPPMPRDAADLAEEIAPSATLGERIRGLGALVRNPGPFLKFDRSLGEPVMNAFTAVEPEWWEMLAVVTAPTLVVSGGPRSFLPPRHLRDLAEALPAGEFTTIEAGHSVHRDRSDEFVAAALAHLR